MNSMKSSERIILGNLNQKYNKLYQTLTDLQFSENIFIGQKLKHVYLIYFFHQFLIFFSLNRADIDCLKLDLPQHKKLCFLRLYHLSHMLMLKNGYCFNADLKIPYQLFQDFFNFKSTFLLKLKSK